MITSALKYLLSLAPNKLDQIGGQTYSEKNLNRIVELSPLAIEATTLTSLVDYIKSGYDRKSSEGLIIHVVSPKRVVLYSELRDDKTREDYFVSKALTPENVKLDQFLDNERFNIMMQSAFVRNEDATILLQIVGNIINNASNETQDDGVSQVTVIKTGVTTVSKALVPNPVVLAPFRTFPEIVQPESKFIFRLKEGGNAALFEADGGAWRNVAMESIKTYLIDALADFSNIKVIS